MKRTALALVVLLLAPVSGARAADEAPYFRSGSDGAPATTLMGEWTAIDDRTYRLELKGGHVAGDRTWFEAGWISPWTTPGGHSEFEMLYDFTSANWSDKLKFFSKYRYKEKGGKWSEWRKHRTMDYEDSVTFWGGGTGAIASWGPLRFEWRAEGYMTRPSIVTGSIEVSVS
jgi:hypothetical protein